MDTKNKTIYIGAAVVLLLIVLLIIVLISRANHVVDMPEPTPTPTPIPTATATPEPTPTPTTAPEPTPTEELPAITPPAETIDPASGSDIVLTTAVPSTATDIEEALKELIEQAQAAEEAAKNTPTP